MKRTIKDINNHYQKQGITISIKDDSQSLSKFIIIGIKSNTLCFRIKEILYKYYTTQPVKEIIQKIDEAIKVGENTFHY